MKKFKYITRCDFGSISRKTVLSRHYNLKSAINGYKKIFNIYHRIHNWTVWLEEVKDKNILNIINEKNFFQSNRCDYI